MIFLYGPLLLPELRRAVLGREAEGALVRAKGWECRIAADGLAQLSPAAGAEVEGVLLRPEAADMARLGFYASAFGQGLVPAGITVEGPEGSFAADVFLPQGGLAKAGAALHPSMPLTGDRARLLTEAAVEFMSRYGTPSAEQAARFYPQVLQRAASRLRAAAALPPRGIRQGRGKVDLVDQRLPYRAFFEVAEAEIRYPKFDGTQSGLTTRAAFLMADAVTVLPYDPVTDRVMMVEQFRIGPHLRGDPLPWTLEPIAGRIDGDEPPEDCARREALEEAGVTLGRMIPVAAYYPTAGAVTEYIYSFIGLADLPLGSAGIGGLAEEEEDIKAHLVSFDEAMAMLDRGEIETAPLVLSLLHLARLRPSLRAEVQ